MLLRCVYNIWYGEKNQPQPVEALSSNKCARVGVDVVEHRALVTLMFRLSRTGQVDCPNHGKSYLRTTRFVNL